MEIIEKAYKIYETRLAVSFNGGKESTLIHPHFCDRSFEVHY